MNAYADELNNIAVAGEKISNDQIQRMAAWSGIFQSHIETIAEKYLEAIGISDEIIGIDWNIYHNSIGIKIEVDEGWNNPPSLDSRAMPIEFLWNENWEELFKTIHEDRLAKEEYNERQREGVKS